MQKALLGIGMLVAFVGVATLPAAADDDAGLIGGFGNGGVVPGLYGGIHGFGGLGGFGLHDAALTNSVFTDSCVHDLRNIWADSDTFTRLKQRTDVSFEDALLGINFVASGGFATPDDIFDIWRTFAVDHSVDQVVDLQADEVNSGLVLGGGVCPGGFVGRSHSPFLGGGLGGYGGCGAVAITPCGGALLGSGLGGGVLGLAPRLGGVHGLGGFGGLAGFGTGTGLIADIHHDASASAVVDSITNLDPNVILTAIAMNNVGLFGFGDLGDLADKDVITGVRHDLDHRIDLDADETVFTLALLA